MHSQRGPIPHIQTRISIDLQSGNFGCDDSHKRGRIIREYIARCIKNYSLDMGKWKKYQMEHICPLISEWNVRQGLWLGKTALECRLES